jgi:apolipoprotein N-acyltransferase
MWTNRTFCARIGAIAAVVWVGVVLIWSQANPRFYWLGSGVYDSALGPAAITAAVGLALIAALAIGIPWIAAARQDDQP